MNAVVDKEELRRTIAGTLDVDVTEVTDDAHFTDELDVDSLMALEVMVVLERTYGVKLDESRLPEMTSFQRAYDLLLEHTGQRA
ncbi:acyl carrier protein [Modestobacter versicolor]|uniref:acyl carrier protein n=1 Tax=Modestobacter versicolor TaxID=429133 RepID=UPI0034E00ADA